MTINEIKKYVLGRSQVFPKSKEGAMFDFLLSRIKELEEGIKKHREITLGYDSGIPEADAELYKLVEKGGEDDIKRD
jgi:hypothetical protein